MNRYAVLEDNLIDEEGNILFNAGTEYMVEDGMILNRQGIGVRFDDLWLNYRVYLRDEEVH